MTQLDVYNAKRALGARLIAWGLTEDPAARASGFIDDLVALGWQMSPSHETRVRAPRLAEECHRHPGQHASACGGCHADQLAGDTDSPAERLSKAEALAAARAALREGASA